MAPPISAIVLSSLSSFRCSHVSHGGQVWGGVRAPLRLDLSAHALRRGERRHGVVIHRRKRRRSDCGDDKIGVADLQLAGALLVLALHDLDLVSKFFIGQGPCGVGIEVARDEAAFVEFEFLQVRAATLGWRLFLGFFLVGFPVWAAIWAALVRLLSCYGGVEHSLLRRRVIFAAPGFCLGEAVIVFVPIVGGQEDVAGIKGEDVFGPAGIRRSLARAQIVSVKRIDVPGVIFQVPIVFPAGGLTALVAENHAENSVGVRRLVPY